MEQLEAKAFACWKVDAPDAYKRNVITQLFDLICKDSNQTTGRLYRELTKILWNVTQVEFDCALASLRILDVIGIHPVPVDGETVASHVNRKKRRCREWKRYQKHVQSIQPDVA